MIIIKIYFNTNDYIQSKQADLICLFDFYPYICI